MLRAVLFDGAGTLFHTREPAGESYAKIAARFGLEADERLVADSFRRAFSAAPGLAFGPGIAAGRLRRISATIVHRAGEVLALDYDVQDDIEMLVVQVFDGAFGI